MTKKSKSRKQDRKLVATLQPHEIANVAKRFGIPPSAVRSATKKAGRSRKKVYQELRDRGYEVVTRKK